MLITYRIDEMFQCYKCGHWCPENIQDTNNVTTCEECGTTFATCIKCSNWRIDKYIVMTLIGRVKNEITFQCTECEHQFTETTYDFL